MIKAKRKPYRELIEQGSFNKPWDCWIWPYATDRCGYGLVTVGGRKVLAHRYSYTCHVGPIPAGLVLDHICHTRACYNPYHLRPVTQEQNMQYRKGLNSDNTSGYRGVAYHRASDKWHARVRHNGKIIYCGSFNCPTKAGLVAAAKRKELGYLGS